MNITACHANGNPLRLEALLEADDFNFAHDVFGIDRHIDRGTGTMMNFFRPRYSEIIPVRESYGLDYYVYHGNKLIRVCPSIGMAHEIAAGIEQ